MDREKIKELTRIFADPFEFLKYVRIQEPGELALEYQLWPHLMEFYRLLETEKLIILDKAKQIGISWALAIRALRKIYTIPAFNVLEISSGGVEAQKLLAKSKIVYENLPDWMKIYTLEPDSTEQFGFKEMHSVIRALCSTDRAGIGETAGWVIHDEADFHDFFELNIGHTLATVADKPERQLTVVSTVDKTKPESYFKTLFKGAKDSGFVEAGSNNFHALFFPYNSRPDRDEAFLEEQKRANEATPWVVEQNYPTSIEESLSPLSVQSCFEKKQVDRLWELSTEAEEVRQGFIHIFYPPRVGTQYVAGADVGEGVGLDYSVLNIIGRDGLNSELVATIYTNTLPTDSFAFEIDRLCREYYNCLLCLDNIGIGRAVSDKLTQLGYPNLYYADKEKKKPGWTLSRNNKRELVVKLIESINNGSLITRFKPQIKELMEYQWVKGHPEPTGKTHGDTVIALMLANEMLKYGGSPFKASMYVGGKQIF